MPRRRNVLLQHRVLGDRGDAEGLEGQDTNDAGIRSKDTVLIPLCTEVSTDLLWKEVPTEVKTRGERLNTGKGNKGKAIPKKVIQCGGSRNSVGTMAQSKE